MPFSDHAAIVARVSSVLTQKGQQCHVVGGVIRDWLLGTETKDIDFAVSGDAAALGQRLAEQLDGTFVLLDEVHGIARVVLQAEPEQVPGQREHPPEWNIDLSSYGGSTIETDLARRDFTVNAMAAEPRRLVEALERTGDAIPSDLLIDPFSGQTDLRSKRLRAVSPAIFEADPARLLRAVRLAAELGFAVEPDTEQLMARHAHLAAQVPGERIREEIVRILTLPGAALRLRYLDWLGLLRQLLPEFDRCKGVEQPTTHFWDVFEHSLETVAAFEFLLRRSRWDHASDEILEPVPWDSEIEAHFSSSFSKGVDRRALLKLGALLHDIAKPETKTLDDTGRARFLGHTQKGAEKAEAMMARLRFSRHEAGLVRDLVDQHLRPVQMSNEGPPTQRAIYRFFRDTQEAGLDVLYLALADHLATRGPLLTMNGWRPHCELTEYILAQHREQQQRVKPYRLVDGHDLMRTLGLQPGPLVGRLLGVIEEAQASGEVGTREEAMSLAREELARQEDLTGIAK